MRLVLLLTIALLIAAPAVALVPTASAGCTEDACDPPPLGTGCDPNDPVAFVHNWKRCL